MKRTQDTTRFRRRAIALSLAAALAIGGAACQPATQSLTAESGEVAVTVTLAGQPVDAHVTLMQEGVFESADTGPDGAVTMHLPAGEWVAEASANGELDWDPPCIDPNAGYMLPSVTVVAEQTRSLEIRLEDVPVDCG